MKRPNFRLTTDYAFGTTPQPNEAHTDWLLDWMLRRFEKDETVFIDLYAEDAQDAILRLIRSLEVDGDGPEVTVTIVTANPELEASYRRMEA